MRSRLILIGRFFELKYQLFLLAKEFSSLVSKGDRMEDLPMLEASRAVLGRLACGGGIHEVVERRSECNYLAFQRPTVAS